MNQEHANDILKRLFMETMNETLKTVRRKCEEGQGADQAEPVYVRLTQTEARFLAMHLDAHSEALTVLRPDHVEDVWSETPPAGR